MSKKNKIIFYLLCLLPLFANGQNNKFEPEWNFGVGFGPTFSSIGFSNTLSNYTRVSTKTWQQYHGGVAVRYISEKNLGVIAELNYSQQGFIQDFGDQKDFAYSRQLNYLELPLLTHIYFGNKIRFVVNLGPKLSFLLSDTENMNKTLADYLASGSVPNSITTDHYYRPIERKVDYGLMGGLGAEFRSGIGNFLLEGRYYFGLGDIFNNSKADPFSRSANTVMSVKLTYYVKLLK